MNFAIGPSGGAATEALAYTQKEFEFEQMCRRHDLTYDYSDDGEVYRAGRASRARIVEAAKQLPREVAARIWNSVVDIKLVPEARASFYWPTERAA